MHYTYRKEELLLEDFHKLELQGIETSMYKIHFKVYIEINI